ncbi:hypothetical protein ACKWTF_014669 [Chironomus riparius]
MFAGLKSFGGMSKKEEANVIVRNANKSNKKAYHGTICREHKEEEVNNFKSFQLDYKNKSMCSPKARIDEMDEFDNDLVMDIKIEPEVIDDQNCIEIVPMDVENLQENHNDFQYNDVNSFISDSKRSVSYNIVSEKSDSNNINEADQAMQQLIEDEKNKKGKTATAKKNIISRKLSAITNFVRKSVDSKPKNVDKEVKMKIEQLGDRKSVHALLPKYDHAFIVTNSVGKHLYMKCFRESCKVKAYRTKEGKFYIEEGEEHSHGSNEEVILTKIEEKKQSDLDKANITNKSVQEVIIQNKKKNMRSGMKSLLNCFRKSNKNSTDNLDNEYSQEKLIPTNTFSHQEENCIDICQTLSHTYIITSLNSDKKYETYADIKPNLTEGPRIPKNGKTQYNDVNSFHTDAHKKPLYTQAEKAIKARQQLEEEMEIEEANQHSALHIVYQKNQLNNALFKIEKKDKTIGGKFKNTYSKIVLKKSQHQSESMAEMKNVMIENMKKSQEAARNKRNITYRDNYHKVYYKN